MAAVLGHSNLGPPSQPTEAWTQTPEVKDLHPRNPITLLAFYLTCTEMTVASMRWSSQKRPLLIGTPNKSVSYSNLAHNIVQFTELCVCVTVTVGETGRVGLGQWCVHTCM